MEVKFYYKNNNYEKDNEVALTLLAIAVSQIIELPDIVEVCLYPLEDNVYGGIDINRINRIGLNINLSLESQLKILVHELIHVSQKHLGMLKIKPNGMCYWHGIPYTKKPPEEMTHEEYTNLPWEFDVQHRQSKVLQQALEILAPAT
jgi:hypothetical protein